MEIKEEDINRDIRIINSYEWYKREKNVEIIKMITNMKMRKK